MTASKDLDKIMEKVIGTGKYPALKDQLLRWKYGTKTRVPWCDHIVQDTMWGKTEWTFECGGINTLARDWTFCPVCGTKNPI